MKPTTLMGLTAVAILALGRASKSSALRVATWNIQGGCSAPMGEGSYRIEDQAAFIKTLGADVVALQESDTPKGRCTAVENRSRQLGRLTGMQYIAEGPLTLLVANTLQVVSRAPVRGFGGKCMRAELRPANGASFVVYNFHGNRFDSQKREAQIAALRALATAEKLPVIILGDFNESRAIPLMGSGFFAAKTGITFTTKAPVDKSVIDKLVKSSSSGSLNEAIDFIFVNKRGRIKSVGVATSAGTLSDHFPVVATVTI
jgi:endonuclease/exonuclease/phosphatase family metal-dependent hydrolase